jgi:hypothetical protein
MVAKALGIFFMIFPIFLLGELFFQGIILVWLIIFISYLSLLLWDYMSGKI